MTSTKKKKVVRKSTKKPGLTPKQKKFCQSYIYDWNGTRSYLAAYPKTKNAHVASVLAVRMLAKDSIKQYIEEIQKDLEKLAGISRMQVLNEHRKLAFSSIAHLHNTWITRKDFEELTDDQKACISEISTSIRKVADMDNVIDVEYVKIKLYDKQKALDSISKMLGYEAAGKLEVTGKDGKDLITKISDDDLDRRIKELESKFK